MLFEDISCKRLSWEKKRRLKDRLKVRDERDENKQFLDRHELGEDERDGVSESKIKPGWLGETGEVKEGDR